VVLLSTTDPRNSAPVRSVVHGVPHRMQKPRKGSSGDTGHPSDARMQPAARRRPAEDIRTEGKDEDLP
jgi:hypothetical protein